MLYPLLTLSTVHVCLSLYQVNAQIRAVYKQGKVMTPSGLVKKLESAVNPVEGKHLYDVVRMNGFTRTLEIGMANGLSTLYLAQVSWCWIKLQAVPRR